MDERPVVLFDGVCNLCAWSVRFIVAHDDGALRFAPLQSDVASELLAEHGLDADYFDSLVYIDGSGAYTKSDGAVRIARHLDAPYRWAWHARHVPRTVRDAAYDLLARVRYRIWGKKDACLVPTDELRERFLAQTA
ncbi:thiol-disulfide oxidoreductase DCC family protein [Halosegnis marinus]|uniref:Thiol-disulfide oxidoreductase DCC family protein n=1 Tax=Halosegnis marinus TaxID=3034023 RepID=A0ABD5ZL78_9EURY|nr:DCC1-like thiol-disulfide oxidoreductase family protein [Halosegnis sp. DT85]